MTGSLQFKSDFEVSLHFELATYHQFHTGDFQHWIGTEPFLAEGLKTINVIPADKNPSCTKKFDLHPIAKHSFQTPQK